MEAMSTDTTTPVTGVDFVSVPTRDLDAAVIFYGEALGLRRTAYRPDRHHAEFSAGQLTLSVIVAEKMGLPFAPNGNHIALHVDDVAAARTELEGRGIEFDGEIFDTGVCHMGLFRDPDGNALMLHHRYAPKEDSA